MTIRSSSFLPLLQTECSALQSLLQLTGGRCIILLLMIKCNLIYIIIIMTVFAGQVVKDLLEEEEGMWRDIYSSQCSAGLDGG